MVVDRTLVERRLLELDTILGELQRQEGSDIDPTALESDLSRPWRRERGLLSAANLVLDIGGNRPEEIDECGFAHLGIERRELG